MRILETQRLYLREMTTADAENAYLLNLDPEVLKYTGDEAFESIESARVFLENYKHYKIYGFGRWAVIHKTDNLFLGWCGLKYTPELDEIDIGYRFLKKYWNQGYATEAAIACIEIGFQKLKLQTIVGHVLKDNIASIKVLEKIGLHFFEERKLDGDEYNVYRIENNAK